MDVRYIAAVGTRGAILRRFPDSTRVCMLPRVPPQDVVESHSNLTGRVGDLPVPSPRRGQTTTL